MTIQLLENPLLTPIFDHVATIVPYTHIGIYYKERNDLRLIAYRGPIPVDHASKFNFPVEKSGGARWVLNHHKPLLIADTLADSALAHSFLEATEEVPQHTFDYIRSWIGFPLTVNGKVEAMLDIAHSDRNFYVEQNILPLQDYLATVEVLIENSILYANLQQSSNETSTLYSIQQAIYSHLDANVVLQLIADHALSITTAKQITIWLKEDHFYKIVSSSGENISILQPGFALSEKSDLLTNAIPDDRPMRVFNVADDQILAKVNLGKYGIRSLLTVPIMVANHPIGAIVATNKVFGAFSQNDERMLGMLAAGATIGIENASLYRDERSRRFVAEGLQQILELFNSDYKLQDLLYKILEIAVRQLRADTGIIIKLDEEPIIYSHSEILQNDIGQLLCTYSNKKDSLKNGGENFQFIPDLISWLNESKFLDVSNDESHINQKLGGLFSSAAVSSLSIHDSSIGCLEIYWQKPRHLHPEERQMITMISKYVSLAIDRDTLNKIAQGMVSLQDRQRIAQDLHDTVAQMLFRIGLDIKWLQQNSNLDDISLKKMSGVQHIVSRCSDEIRSAIFALGNKELSDEDSLIDLLQDLIGDMQYQFGFQIPLICPPEALQATLPIKEAIYRIVRESLINISKHANATVAMVSLDQDQDQITITIQDNGLGLNKKLKDDQSGMHFGLNMMRQLVSPLGGDIEIKNGDEQGVLVKAKFPRKLT